ncbi:AmmeMemoRadiSam system protein B [Rhizobium johnstonii]
MTRRAALQAISLAITCLGAWALNPARSIARPVIGQTPVTSLYLDPAPFLRAIALERVEIAQPISVVGITVPHHLLAADLIARGFWAVSGNLFDRIIILSPNHIARTPLLATTLQDFCTPLGDVKNDTAAASALLAHADFEESDRFDREHGVQALLPFVRWFFPEAKVVPIVVSATATRADWDKAIFAIEDLITPRTLLVQSTDFSHYLRPDIAVLRDQETLNVIAAKDREMAADLLHPDHMDSKGCQYIQMALQSKLDSHPVVIANRNSAEYVPGATNTTSYFVMAYLRRGTDRFPLSYEDQDVLYFAGDGLFGRWMTSCLADPEISKRLVAVVTDLTGGAPLIVNLEGPILDEPPVGLPINSHCMYASLAVPTLKAFNVCAASLANNHAFDLGEVGLQETISSLERAGIAPLLHGRSTNLGPCRVLALNFVNGRQRAGHPIIQSGEIEDLHELAAHPPLFAFVHWGSEYSNVHSEREEMIASALHNAGVGATIGAHTHVAADQIEVRQGGEYQFCYSLGNFVFDQSFPRTSGCLMEVRIFRQKTFATRLLAMPNLFEVGKTLSAPEAPGNRLS